MLRYLAAQVRRITLLTRLIFGVTVPRGKQIHWDFTTIMLKSSLAHRVQSGQKVLEIGTGPYGILAMYLSKYRRCDIVATDINEEYVARARRAVALNRVPATVVRSDLFADIEGTFDIIYFNSVYIPKKAGERLRLDRIHRYETDWCGGDSGLETIERFLRGAPDRMGPAAQVFLGFNPRYVTENAVLQVCHTHGYQVRHRDVSFCNPSIVIILERA